MNITQKENDRLFEITACVTLKKGEGRALKAGGAWFTIMKSLPSRGILSPETWSG